VFWEGIRVVSRVDVAVYLVIIVCIFLGHTISVHFAQLLWWTVVINLLLEVREAIPG